jgi:mRNA-degrading endonuclease RelE of RelBE toxin-antitoxin system
VIIRLCRGFSGTIKGGFLNISPTWRVNLSSKVEKQVSQNRHMLQQIFNALAKVIHNPYGGPDIEALEGFDNRYRVRVNGRIRIIYRVIDQDRVIYLEDFGHRDEVYSRQ